MTYSFRLWRYDKGVCVFHENEVVKNFDIIIEPQNLEYHFKENSEPLKIEDSIEAEKIEIQFNNQ